MHISKLVLGDIRCFEGDVPFEFSSGINLLVGSNNSGKSTAIWPLTLMQPLQGGRDLSALFGGRRLKTNSSHIIVEFGGADTAKYESCSEIFAENFWPNFKVRMRENVGISTHGSTRNSGRGQHSQNVNSPVFPNSEPGNLFHYFLSRRKVVEFSHAVNAATTLAVRHNFTHLHAKVAKLSLAHDPNHKIFNSYLRAVLGFEVSSNMTSQGQQTSLFADGAAIPIEMMGEGTANIVALLADLATARGKIFLVEELENDIHPGALIALLEVIKESTETNQFIISTHSNIVVSRLGALPRTRIFALEMALKNGIPTTSVETLPSTPTARFELMRSLGYELSDLSIADGYLILEESSAEAIIREILIPFLVPHLIGRIRTHSSGGVGNVKKRYEALYSLFVFLHTAPVYQNRSWVRIDSGAPGTEILQQLAKRFPEDCEFKFRSYSELDFEKYYPQAFQARADEVLAIGDKTLRQEAKRVLCKEVLAWASANQDAAKAAFSESAKEVIQDLHEIAKRIV